MEKRVAVVVGSGIGGLNTAFSLIEKGYRVKVIEKSPYIGGKLRQLDFQFPNDACGMCQVYPIYDSGFCDMCIRRGIQHKDIEFYTLTEVLSVKKEKEKYKIRVKVLPRGVNHNCTCCGECESVCPEYRFSDFNYVKQKAIFRDYPRNFPDIYTIDFNACTKCGECVKVCPENAISLNEEPKEEIIEASYVFVAPGIKERDITYLREFGFGRYPNVIMSTHFERLLSGSHPNKGMLRRPSDGKVPRKIAFIQCMGSRDKDNPLCSSICCMFTLKEVRILKEYYPDAEPWIFYMDMRAYTKGGYRYFKETKAQFVNARPAKIEEEEDGNLLLYFESEGKFRKESFDLVVLSVGTEVELPEFVNTSGVYLLYDRPLEIREVILRSYDAVLNTQPIERSDDEGIHFPLKDEYKVAVVDTVGKYEKKGVLKFKSLKDEKDVRDLIIELEKEGIDLFAIIVRSRFVAERLLSKYINPLVYEIIDSERENDVDFAVKRALLKLRYRVPPRYNAQVPDKNVLVIGGGVAGLSAALELAKKGVRVHIVEKESELGGEGIHVKRKMDLSDEKLITLLKEEVMNKRIPVYVNTEFIDLRGVPGNYVAVLKKNDEVINLGVSAIVLATGAKAYIPSEYYYKESSKVITQREFEEFFDDNDIKSLKSVVMIQCVGSRNEEFPVCSIVCCRDALKNAIYLKKLNPKVEVFVLYRDMMSFGDNELYFNEARKLGVIFIRYKDDELPVISRNRDELKIKVHDKIFNMDLEIIPDLVILSTGFRPHEGNKSISDKLGISLDEDGFFNTLNIKFNPIQTQNAGVFVAGTALSPMTISDAARSGRAAASKVVDFLNNFGIRKRYVVSETKERICAGCGICENVCPFGARYIDEDDKVAKVLYDICQACGLCVASCPSGSAYMVGEETKSIIQVLTDI